jgi:creatinine amidohydrolase
MRFEESSRSALREAATDALLVLPVGAIEQHGPHLPTGTDTFHVIEVAERAAALAAERIPVVLAPVLPFGSSAHHLPFGGTLSLSTATYLTVVTELVESLIGAGFSRLFILNSHGGNHELVQLVARDVALRRDVHIAAGSWWAIAWDALLQAGAGAAGRFPGHAGQFESSIVRHLRPDLVDPTALPHREGPVPPARAHFEPSYRAEHHGSWQAIDGFSDSPDLADAALGARWLDVSIAPVAAAFVAFQREAGGPVRDPGPVS